jgi:predicted nucleotidyltransferase
MRISLVRALFPSTREAILSRTFSEPERWWYLSDLTSQIGRKHPSSLQRELASLVSAGILLRRRDGNRVYFSANRDCPVFAEIVGLVAKTSGLPEMVRGALARFAGRIKLGFIYGSIARREEQAASDVDLVVVGSVGLADVAPALRKLEDRLGRAVNAMVYSETEFLGKLKEGNHFLNQVLEAEKLFVAGSQDELDQLTSGQPRSAARDKPTGDR